MKYQNKDTPIHQIGPIFKILYSISVAVFIVILKKPLELSLLTLFVLVIFFLTKPRPNQIKALIIVILTIVATTIISQSIFYYFSPKTRLFTLLSKDVPLIGWMTQGIYVYKEGVVYGAIQSLRIISAIFMATTIVVTTHPSAMIMALHKLRLPKDLSFVISVSIRFFPQLFDEIRRIFLAIRLKGLKIKGIKNSLKVLRLLLSPLIINSLRRARMVALAAEVRGFSSGENIINIKKRLFNFDTLELITIAFFVVLLYLAILPFKMGLSRIPFLDTFFFSIPFTCILFIGIRIVPKFGTATFLICGNSLFTQIISSGINPLWWPYALAESLTLEGYLLLTKDYIGSTFSAIVAGALRGLVVYLYFYFLSAPLIWHRYYALWFIIVNTVQGAVGSAIGGVFGYKISRTIEKAYKYGGI
jgi:energy-coupling factor transport system permease protein